MSAESGGGAAAATAAAAAAGRGHGRGRGGRGRGRGRGGRGGTGTSSNEGGGPPKGNRNNNNKGRNNRGRRSNNNNINTNKTPAAPQLSEEEKQRLEEEQKAAEAAEVERKRLEEEQKALEAARQERRKAKEELETKVRIASDALKTNLDATVTRKENREELSLEALAAFRKTFAAKKKSLKSDLKKCTAFVKKIRSGGAWNMKPADIHRDVSTLNLSRYVDEVVVALLEADPKMKDMPVILELSKAMHLRYPEFLLNLLPKMWSVIQAKPSEDTAKLRRIYVRILAEFVLNGIGNETKPLVKLIAECTGGKDGSYVVTDANIIVAFVKTAGFEILGVTAESIQQHSSMIQQEAEKQQAHAEIAAAAEAPVAEGDGVPNEEQQTKAEEPLIISSKLATEGLSNLENLQGLLNERAVAPEVSELLLAHFKGAYKTMSHTLVTTHAKLQKMEKRCEQDRLLAGTLTDAREKGLADARKLKDSLLKGVETLSDILALPMPQLKEEESEETDGSGTGIELWTKEGGNEDDFGPFDDEETRAFYCDIPDLLTTVPPALLSMSQGEIDKRKAENIAKYGSGFDGLADDEGDGDAPEIAASSEAELEAAEQEEGKESEENQEGT
jgi:regulator of nonsense transcripts 2